MYSRGEPLDFAQSYRKAADYCAAEEHCAHDLLKKFRDWRIDSKFVQEILEKLIDEKFIDEFRYAKAFVRGKFKNLRWGKFKIINELRARNIPSGFIATAIQEEFDEDAYRECAKQLFEKKLRQLGKNTKENKQKAIYFLIGKGFGDVAYLLDE